MELPAEAPPSKDTDHTSNSRHPDSLCSCWLDSLEPWAFSFHPQKEAGPTFAKQLTLGLSLTLWYDIFDLEITETQPFLYSEGPGTIGEDNITVNSHIKSRRQVLSLNPFC